MAQAIFDRVCETLEEATELSRLEARGTVRLALKEAGLDARDVSADQLRVVLEKLLPRELSSRGIAGATAVCERLLAKVPADEAAGGADEAPEAVFARLARPR